jgi:hypothetical protein
VGGIRRAVRTLVCILGALGAPSLAGPQEPAPRPPPSLSPLVIDSLAPLLASWIAAARDATKAEGVEPIPSTIRAALTGYVPEETLDRVTWRHGGSALSLPQNIIQFGDLDAMTLDDVIVFRDRSAALEDPKLWAHELKHVMQFTAWSVDGFATRYLRDYEAVESEAVEFRWQFMKQAGLVPAVPAPAE